VAAFAKVIEKFQKTTSALVIDQVNNPGGSVFYLYTLASMLSDQPLTTPLHEMSLVQADILDAVQFLDKLKDVNDDESARKIIGANIGGYPISYEVAVFARDFFHFVMDEWKADRRLTQPHWLYGVQKINPAPIHYTKPILLLTNALDFSGGDFFPAILQDNKRVTILGTRTAGAGGYVNDVQYPNDLGIASFRVTESIAKRVDDNPIENLGVKPDVDYQMVEADLTDNYSSYLKSIQSAFKSLIKP
jgi:C-terminal processing protease CtpA/Prc